MVSSEPTQKWPPLSTSPQPASISSPRNASSTTQGGHEIVKLKRQVEPSVKDGVMDIPRKPIAQITRQTGIAFSSHDLKRTFLTIGEAVMIPFSLLKALANHKTSNDVTGGYINAEAKTRKDATFKIADYIQAHTRPDSDNVVTLKTATR